MLMTACASRPSSFSSHCACEPRPTGTLCATTSKTPPTVWPAFLNGVHFRLHFLLGGGIDAAQRRREIVADGKNLFPGGRAIDSRMAHLRGMAGDFNGKGAKQLLGERAGSHPRCGFPRRGSLEDEAGIVKVEFLRAGQVRMAGARGD